MRSIAAKLLVGVAITAIAMYGADNSIGTWKRNIEKSKTTATDPNPITSLTTVRQAVQGGVKATSTGTRKEGTAINASYTAMYDGKDVPVAGAPWDSTWVKQIDANKFTSENKKSGGKYHTTSRTAISKDGKIMIVAVKGADASGKPFTATYIYDKQ